MEEHVDDRVGLPLVGRADRAEAPAGDGIGLIEEEHRVLASGRAEHRGHVLRRLPHPAGLELGIANHQELLVEGEGERLGADRLAGAGRPGKVEGEPEPRRVPLGQTPLLKDQVVLPHQGQRVIEGAQGGCRQNDIVEGTSRLDCFHQLAAAGDASKKKITDRISHGCNMPGAYGDAYTTGPTCRSPLPGSPERSPIPLASTDGAGTRC